MSEPTDPPLRARGCASYPHCPADRPTDFEGKCYYDCAGSPDEVVVPA